MVKFGVISTDILRVVIASIIVSKKNCKGMMGADKVFTSMVPANILEFP